LRKAYPFTVILLSFFLLITVVTVSGETITKKTITIEIPRDHDNKAPYKTELVVSENMTAFNLTVWGAEKSWGIAAVSPATGGVTDEIYRYVPPSSLYSEPIPDAESTEEMDNANPGEREGYGDVNAGSTPLSKIVLPPGSYVIWTYEGAGKSIVIEYFLGTGK
jgi:hypothetical protein